MIQRHVSRKIRKGVAFTNVSGARQNIISKFVYCRNHVFQENVKLKLCAFAQNDVLGARTKFQIEILTINMISGIVYFHEIILENSRNVSETTPQERELWVAWFIHNRFRDVVAIL